MSNKRFVPHRFAVQDEEEIVLYYEKTSPEHVALGFIMRWIKPSHNSVVTRKWAHLAQITTWTLTGFVRGL